MSCRLLFGAGIGISWCVWAVQAVENHTSSAGLHRDFPSWICGSALTALKDAGQHGGGLGIYRTFTLVPCHKITRYFTESLFIETQRVGHGAVESIYITLELAQCSCEAFWTQLLCCVCLNSQICGPVTRHYLTFILKPLKPSSQWAHLLLSVCVCVCTWAPLCPLHSYPLQFSLFKERHPMV